MVILGNQSKLAADHVSVHYPHSTHRNLMSSLPVVDHIYCILRLGAIDCCFEDVPARNQFSSFPTVADDRPFLQSRIPSRPPQSLSVVEWWTVSQQPLVFCSRRQFPATRPRSIHLVGRFQSHRLTRQSKHLQPRSSCMIHSSRYQRSVASPCSCRRTCRCIGRVG
jgi:hypothetical protein